MPVLVSFECLKKISKLEDCYISVSQNLILVVIKMRCEGFSFLWNVEDPIKEINPANTVSTPCYTLLLY